MVAVLDEDNSNRVIFMTIQKLIGIWKPNSKTPAPKRKELERLFSKLKSEVGLVIIDEGHYEPAYLWSQCIREFSESSKIVFTATPYRNDLKEFDVDSMHQYFCSYKKSLGNKNLRKVQAIPSTSKLDEQAFIENAIKQFGSLRKNGSLEATAKLIVRCDDKNKIARMADFLQAKKI